jgi:hypothetical protein
MWSWTLWLSTLVYGITMTVIGSLIGIEVYRWRVTVIMIATVVVMELYLGLDRLLRTRFRKGT